MLLKKIVLLLLLANLGYAAYSNGWLSALSGAESNQREPERLGRQVNAQAIEVRQELPTHQDVLGSEPAVMEVKVGGSAACKSPLPSAEQWLIYMGPYASKELLVKKKTELAKLAIDSTEVSKTSLPRGLSLGRYATETDARSALEALQRKGIKTATVLLWTSTAKEPGC